MSAAEQLEDGRSKAAAPRDALMEAEAVIEAPLAEAPARSAKLRPLLALAPYVARYRGRAFLAFIALTIAAVTTLVKMMKMMTAVRIDRAICERRAAS